MKVLHFCLSNFYFDGMNYQENALIREHVKAGHDVLVIASTENMDSSKQITYVEPQDYIGAEGARVIRLPYRGWPYFLARKIRAHPGVYDLTKDFAPDAILFHSLCGWELLTVARYKRDHPEVNFNADSHEDEHNSAKSFVSKNILHKLYYGSVLRRALPFISSIFCISKETIDFVEKTYRIPRERLSFLPLAGNPVSREELAQKRKPLRAAMDVGDEDILFLQTGKFIGLKKLVECLEAFSKTSNPNFKFLVVGVLEPEVKEQALALINADQRIEYKGWADRIQMEDYLLACDVYLQPGSQSATMQQSLCAGCSIVVQDYPSHHVFLRNNGWMLNDDCSLEDVFSSISSDPAQLADQSQQSTKIAFELLDYEEQAKRVLVP